VSPLNSTPCSFPFLIDTMQQLQEAKYVCSYTYCCAQHTIQIRFKFGGLHGVPPIRLVASNTLSVISTVPALIGKG
jgi:hypothetical protein